MTSALVRSSGWPVSTAEHTLETGHPLDLTKAEIIDRHQQTMMGCWDGIRELAHSEEPRHTEQGERLKNSHSFSSETSTGNVRRPDLAPLMSR